MAPPLLTGPQFVTHTLQGVSVISDTQLYPGVALPKSILRLVQPFIIDSIADRIPHGRLFCQVVVYSAHTTGTPNPSAFTQAVVWAGYITARAAGTQKSPEMPPSVPEIYIEEGQVIEMQLTHCSQGVAVNVGCRVVVDRDPDAKPGGAFIHNELPGDGSGEVFQITTADPAAGAVPAAIVTPDECHRRYRALGCIIARGAVGGSRLSLSYETGAGVARCHTGTPEMTAATVNLRIGAMLNGPQTPSPASTIGAVVFPLPDIRLQATDQLDFADSVIQATDNLSAITLEVEEWAVPV